MLLSRQTLPVLGVQAQARGRGVWGAGPVRPWARPWRRGGLRQEALPEQQAACTGTRAGDGLRELPAAPSGHLGRPLPGQACSLDAQGAGEHRVSVEREQAVAEASRVQPGPAQAPRAPLRSRPRKGPSIRRHPRPC